MADFIEIPNKPPILRARMRASDFDFSLPEELIAQQPLPQRDASRLLVFERLPRKISHAVFPTLVDLLQRGDLLVLNDSKVIQARLHGKNERTHGGFELLLVEEKGVNDWWAMVKPGKRARVGTRMRLLDRAAQPTDIVGEVVETNEEGHRRLQFSNCLDICDELDRLGEVPLPPYIRRPSGEADLERYQTVFAAPPGSVAAPTAGLHFTRGLLDRLRSKGIEIAYVTLHVGLGTFAPVKSESLESHTMHSESYTVSSETAARIMAAKQAGRRIVAVGTTALRTLESAWTPEGIRPGPGTTRLFVHPPFHFHVVDALLTNFHLPRSTLLMLVSAFTAPASLEGVELIRRVYGEAIRERYRFFSYGDAMLIL